MEAVQQDETFACLVDPHTEGAVPGHGRIQVLDTPFGGIKFEPFEGVFIHGGARVHT
ncbi:hypothetical protein D9M71_832050 [compost metagenome]